ncbi:hypothetical protein [Saccharopolyspora taberi]|uniref:Uncharacterized protein n=1 Tax=Saccharopolyspora taberi TaxID=60895 RepID=A0ABN3VM81_9PSEU
MRIRPPFELRVLRELFQTRDPAPERAVESAYAAASRRWADRGAAVLRLIGDSADTPGKTRTSATAEARVLTFAMPGSLLEVDLVPTVQGMYRATGLVLASSGQGTPSGDVVLRHATGECVGELDDQGGFEVDDVPRGPLSVVLRQDEAAPAVTDWLVC